MPFEYPLAHRYLPRAIGRRDCALDCVVTTYDACECPTHVAYLGQVLGVLIFAVGGGLLLLWYIKHYASKLVVTKHEAVGERFS